MADSTPPTEPAVITRFDDKFRAVLALALIIGFFGFLFFASINPPKLPGDLLGAVVGYIAGWISAMVGFYWGGISGNHPISKTPTAPTGITVTPAPDATVTTTTNVTTEPPKP